MRSKTLCCLILAGMTALSAACARRVSLDSYASPSGAGTVPPRGAAVSVAGNRDVPNPVFDEQVRRKLEKLLQTQGYRVAPRGEADYELQYFYRIEAEPRTRLEPVFDGFGCWDCRFRGGYDDALFPAPLYHSMLVEETYPVYVAKLRLRITDLGGSENEKKTVWVGETWADSRHKDLRDSIDYLLAAGVPNIGRDTKNVKDLYISPDDALLKQLKETGTAAAR